MLINQHYKSRRKGSMFFNDDKISLNSSLIQDATKLNVFKSCYYLSYLTNDISTLDIEDVSNKAEPDVIWAGLENFPYNKGNQSSPNRMKTLESSNMSNHLGGNTIAFTSSGRMVLWRQSNTAIRSNGLLAPTGSGSLDYLDYESLVDKKLNQLAIKGMER